MNKDSINFDDLTLLLNCVCSEADIKSIVFEPSDIIITVELRASSVKNVRQQNSINNLSEIIKSFDTPK